MASPGVVRDLDGRRLLAELGRCEVDAPNTCAMDGVLSAPLRFSSRLPSPWSWTQSLLKGRSASAQNVAASSVRSTCPLLSAHLGKCGGMPRCRPRPGPFGTLLVAAAALGGRPLLWCLRKRLPAVVSFRNSMTVSAAPPPFLKACRRLRVATWAAFCPFSAPMSCPTVSWVGFAFTADVARSRASAWLTKSPTTDAAAGKAVAALGGAAAAVVPVGAEETPAPLPVAAFGVAAAAVVPAGAEETPAPLLPGV